MPEVSEDVLGWVRFSIETEEKGLVFYRECLRNARNQHYQMLFDFLVKQEASHKKLLSDLLKELAEGRRGKIKASYDALKKIELENPLFSPKDLEEIQRKDLSIAETLNKALDLERQSMALYSDIAAKATDEYVKRFFLEMAKQEKTHFDDIALYGGGLV